uniref:TSA: Wollemia nobilis Ref_Wollemi_Transcript_2419_1722 transcribed RNA sequence n=1 Tax=Wollemia nobilis TaxID=56998 RepID=A0A0C9SAM7_9CONI
MAGKENIKPMISLQPQASDPIVLPSIKQEQNPIVQNHTVMNNVKNETVDNSGDSKWQDLPMELLMRILMFVDARTVIIASGVCTGWRETTGDGVQELSLSWCKQNMNNLVLSIIPRFTHLQSLNLRQNQHQLNDHAVEMVAKFCHDLRVLDLSNSTQLTDKSLEALAHGCNQLEKLNISGCNAINDSALILLAEKCNKLRHVYLCGCHRAVTDRALLALAHNCCRLQCLNLGWCEKVTDVGVTGLAQWCPDLRAVDLCGCVLITDQSIIALAENCPHLRSLGLYYCQNITDIAMYSLACSNIYRPVKPNLKHKRPHTRYNTDSVFQASGMHDSPRRSFGGPSSCSISDRNAAASRDYMESVLNDQEEECGLMKLNIGQCTSLSAPAVQAVCDAFPALHTCPGRHSLIISGCLNLTSVHCVCAVEALRERRNKAASSPPGIVNARLVP